MDGSRYFVATESKIRKTHENLIPNVAGSGSDCWFIELDGQDVERLIDPTAR